MGKYPCAWYIYIIKVIMSSLDCFSPLILCHPILQGVKLFKRPTYQHRPVNFVTVSWGATMRQLILSSGCRGDDHQPWDGAVFKDRLVTDSLLLFHIYKINIYIYICCCSIVPYVTYIPCFSFFSCSSVCIIEISLRWKNSVSMNYWISFYPFVGNVFTLASFWSSLLNC